MYRKEEQMPDTIHIRCITNRHLSAQNYLTQLRQIAQAGPEALIVREKDLSQEDYERLAAEVLAICAQYKLPCILHTYVQAAVHLGVRAIHLPLRHLLSLSEEQKSYFSVLGASVHSAEEALQAQRAGATYLTAGHVYATDCKRGVPPRGLAFLQQVCAVSRIPVYALGGIRAENAAACIQSGAQGVCIMSECMQHTDIEERLQNYHL